tara:strand:+ start:108 stop:1382 length:1275 start_codon:yes stop_codon:yes gene_type:complete
MAVIQAKTRAELRQSIGYSLGACTVGTASANTDTITLKDTINLFGGDDEYNGSWIVVTDATDNTVNIRRITDYTASTNLITISPALSFNVASGDSYEIYDNDLPPARIHDFINRSISSITRKGAPAMTDFTLHSSREVYSYALPSDLIGLQKVEYRNKYFGKSLLTCDSAFDENVTGVTSVVVDEEDHREGVGANKMVIPSGTSTNAILISDSISSTDISGYTHIEFWIKTNVALTAGQFAVRVSAVANNATSGVYEDVSVPATSVDTWTHHRVAFSSAENLTAIISVGLIQVADIGAATVSIDDIKVSRDYGASYEEIHRNFYTIDRANRRLVFDENARAFINNSLIKLTGVKKPTLLTADSTSCDVEPEYIIQKATAMALLARSDRSSERREAAQLDSERMNLLAEQTLAKSQTPQRCVWID